MGLHPSCLYALPKESLGLSKVSNTHCDLTVTRWVRCKGAGSWCQIFIGKQRVRAVTRRCAELSVPDAVRELRVGHQEGRDAAGVQLLHQGVDFRIHDRLAHQRQRAVPRLRQTHSGLSSPQVSRDAGGGEGCSGHLSDMVCLTGMRSRRPGRPQRGTSQGVLAKQWSRLVLEGHLHALGQALWHDTGNALELIDHADVVAQRPFHNAVRIIHLPTPLPPHCTLHPLSLQYTARPLTDSSSRVHCCTVLQQEHPATGMIKMSDR